MRIGFGYDSHRLAENRHLILGGVDIPYELGLEGHSDADVLIHAICDAILGALGEDDIGCMYPDKDPKYKDISSLVLLENVVDIMRRKQYEICNLDTSIIMEKPKMRPYVPDMIRNLSTIMNIEAEKINIKAKTNEGMGFVGRQEGVAAFAVVIIQEK